MDETSHGQKRSVSNSSSIPFSMLVEAQGISWSSETTKESSKHGKTGGADLGKSTSSSGEFTLSSNSANAMFTQNTSEAKTTQQTSPPGDSFFQSVYYSPFNRSPQMYNDGSKTTISTDYPRDNSRDMSLASQVSTRSNATTPTTSTHPVATNPNPPTRMNTATSQNSSAGKKSRFNQPLPSVPSLSGPPRPYPKDLTPSPSILRPHCHARDRLRLWKPFGATDQSNVLSPTNIERLERLMECAWSENTRSTYGSGLLAFHVWCDHARISEQERAPASGATINLFISAMAGGFAKDTVTNYLAGVRAWHILHYIPWEVDQLQYQTILKALDSVTPPSSRRAKRKPCTVEHLLSIRSALDISQPLGAAIWACATSLFYGIARLGELTVPNREAFVPGNFVEISNVSEDSDRNGFQTTTIRIPFTKSSRAKGNSKGEDIFWAKQNNDTDPKFALDNHIAVNNPESGEHLFSYSMPSQPRRPLTRHVFLVEITRALRKAGREQIKGHSFRIGGTLEYLLRNVPFEVVKSQGRWASDAFRVYLREHARVMAPFVQDIPNLREAFIELHLSTDD